MTYQEAIDRIHEFQRFGSKLGLERMMVLMELLGNPQKGMRIIHVAGTNGKGSVSRFLASVLRANGYRVGLYTSPFLERFTERIEFDGKEIGEEELAACVEEVLPRVDRMLASGQESPTEFELVTAMAFHYFSKMPMDFLILEVGLGGSGDSTNIIETPLVSVITSISYDHMVQLGNSLEQIALEKAGIIKAGRPVISWAKEPAAAVIRQIAGEKGSPYFGRESMQVEGWKGSRSGSVFSVFSSFRQTLLKDLTISMLGEHQVENACCALTVIELLRKQGIIDADDEKVRIGLKQARHPGRMEILQKSPLILVDGAHNHDGAKALVKGVKDFFPNQRTLLVIGMLEDKEVDKMLAEFLKLPGDVIAAEPDNPRRLPASELARMIVEAGRNCVAALDGKVACDYIEKHLKDYDLIVAAGSLYLIGIIRGRLKNESN